jgi:DNA-binding transcriptional ArsR family regulator
MKRVDPGAAVVLTFWLMVNHTVKSEELDRVFGALAHPTRRAVLRRLSRGEASVGELAAPFQVSLPAITRHLHVLEDAGLIGRVVDGRMHRMHLQADPMRDAAEWITTYAKFWSDQFDALDRFLARSDSEQHPHPDPPPSKGEGDALKED